MDIKLTMFAMCFMRPEVKELISQLIGLRRFCVDTKESLPDGIYHQKPRKMIVTHDINNQDEDDQISAKG